MSEVQSPQVNQRPVRRVDAATTGWRGARATELALAGHSYDDIAEHVGYANRGTARRVVQRALRSKKLNSVDEYRALELARLDALLAAHWEATLSGTDLKSAELCVRVSAQRIPWSS